MLHQLPPLEFGHAKQARNGGSESGSDSAVVSRGASVENKHDIAILLLHTVSQCTTSNFMQLDTRSPACTRRVHSPRSSIPMLRWP